MLERKQGGLTATWKHDVVPVAHLGCKLNKSLLTTLAPEDRKRIVATLGDSLPKGWKSAKDVQDRIAEGCIDAIRQLQESGLNICGVTLIDTMRGGSDYYRPGNLITGVAGRIRAQGYECGYDREDDLCPTSKLLDQFRQEDMRFGDYAESYNRDLLNHLDTALNLCAISLARGRLPVFYCVDPYIPGFADGEQFLSDQSFSERDWISNGEPCLQDAGCHRVVLIEAVAKELLRQRHPVSISAVIPDERISRMRTYGATG